MVQLGGRNDRTEAATQMYELAEGVNRLSVAANDDHKSPESADLAAGISK